MLLENTYERLSVAPLLRIEACEPASSRIARIFEGLPTVFSDSPRVGVVQTVRVQAATFPASTALAGKVKKNSHLKSASLALVFTAMRTQRTKSRVVDGENRFLHLANLLEASRYAVFSPETNFE